MRSTLRGLGLMLMLAIVLAGSIGSASAAHNGNNKATLTGAGGVTGTAIVNYSEGTGTFNGSTTVRNLEPNTFYTFSVRLGVNEATDQLICSGTSNDQGLFRCSDQGLTLNGFSTAVIEDGAGNDVATGTFLRRGNCRDADQAGSQCESNDTRQNPPRD